MPVPSCYGPPPEGYQFREMSTGCYVCINAYSGPYNYFKTLPLMQAERETHDVDDHEPISPEHLRHTFT